MCVDEMRSVLIICPMMSGAARSTTSLSIEAPIRAADATVAALTSSCKSRIRMCLCWEKYIPSILSSASPTFSFAPAHGVFVLALVSSALMIIATPVPSSVSVNTASTLTNSDILASMIRPKSSSPTRPIKNVLMPSLPQATASLAPFPPGRVWNDWPGWVELGSGNVSVWATRSIFTLPKTTTADAQSSVRSLGCFADSRWVDAAVCESKICCADKLSKFSIVSLRNEMIFPTFVRVNVEIIELCSTLRSFGFDSANRILFRTSSAIWASSFDRDDVVCRNDAAGDRPPPRAGDRPPPRVAARSNGTNGIFKTNFFIETWSTDEGLDVAIDPQVLVEDSGNDPDRAIGTAGDECLLFVGGTLPSAPDAIVYQCCECVCVCVQGVCPAVSLSRHDGDDATSGASSSLASTLPYPPLPPQPRTTVTVRCGQAHTKWPHGHSSRRITQLSRDHHLSQISPISPRKHPPAWLSIQS
eukprot:m.61701 g.61701  ORF g.61701 m.61701 type:complete len:473 (-) comp17600_c0_seq2:18-1436(-)